MRREAALGAAVLLPLRAPPPFSLQPSILFLSRRVFRGITKVNVQRWEVTDDKYIGIVLE